MQNMYSPRTTAMVLALAFSTITLSVKASDNQAAIINKVGTCVACHGADGIGKDDQYPNLKGQKAAYLEKQLKAFRSGDRKDPNMAPMARPLSDEDIADLAAYYAEVQ